MLGLDNKGWGTKTMIILTCVILIALLIATYYVAALYSNIDRNKHKTVKPAIIETKDNNKKEDDLYSQYELLLARSAVSFAKENNLDVTTDFYVVTYDTLIANGYLSPINDLKNKKECDGYVHVYSIVSGEYSSKAFLKCSNYITEGYDFE